jgi:hypothetical protein
MAMVRVDQDTDAVRAAVDPAADTARQFASAEELAVWAGPRPLSWLVALWNTLPGVVPVTRFTDRKTALTRIWRALQHPGEHPNERGRKRPLARPSSKKARVIALLRQRRGASLHEIMAATGWQAHTVRAFISRSLVRQAHLQITSSRRPDGERVYRANGR